MSSDFTIAVDAQAARDLKSLAKLHHPCLIRIKKAIDSLARHPYEGKPLKGSKKGCRSLREGDFRIIYEIHEDQRLIFLIRIGDRKEIYR